MRAAPASSASSRRPWSIGRETLDRLQDRHPALSFARRWRAAGFVVVPAALHRPLSYMASDPMKPVQKERIGYARYWSGMPEAKNWRAFLSDIRSAREPVSALMVMAPPHVVAVDVDVYDRAPAVLLADFARWAGVEPAAAHVTPNGGIRCLYPIATGREIAARIDRKACPFRAEVLTGPFVAAPSYGPGGIECPWLVGSVTTLPPAPANENPRPTVMRPKLLPRRGGPVASPHRKPGHVGQIPEEDKRIACGSGMIRIHHRNNAGWFALMVLVQALGADATFMEARTAFQEKIEPRLEQPLSPGEVKSIVRSVVRYTSDGRNFVRPELWSGASRRDRFRDFVDARSIEAAGKPFSLADFRAHGFRHEDIKRAVGEGMIEKHGERDQPWEPQMFVKRAASHDQEVERVEGELSSLKKGQRGAADGASTPEPSSRDRTTTTAVGEDADDAGSAPVAVTLGSSGFSGSVPPQLPEEGVRPTDPRRSCRGSGPPAPVSPPEHHDRNTRAEASDREDLITDDDEDELVLLAVA